MNTRGEASDGYADGDRLPTGLILALAQNMHAMEQYASLGEQGRRKLIEQASRVHSRAEMQALVQSMTKFL